MAKGVKKMNKILRYFLDIFYPNRCVGCGAHGHLLCFPCVEKIEMIKTNLCQECGKISQNGKYCQNCKARLATNLRGVIVATHYGEGPIKELVHHLKYNGLIELSEIAGELMANKLISINLRSLDKFILVPVPLHKKRQKERGFNQSLLIADYMAKRLGILVADLLVRNVETRTQVGLSKKERVKNIANAFSIKTTDIPEKVLLVDDVVTTGSTLVECAKVLSAAGVKEIWAIVLARNI
jgi:ComF family protein